MAKAHIAEYGGLRMTSNGMSTYPMEPALVQQAVTYTTATQSAAFGDSTKLIRLCCDADAYVVFGADPTADADSFFVPTDTIVEFGVQPGHKVSIYDGST